MEGWVDRDSWLHTETVYMSADIVTYPSSIRTRYSSSSLSQAVAVMWSNLNQLIMLWASRLPWLRQWWLSVTALGLQPTENNNYDKKRKVVVHVYCRYRFQSEHEVTEAGESTACGGVVVGTSDGLVATSVAECSTPAAEHWMYGTTTDQVDRWTTAAQV